MQSLNNHDANLYSEMCEHAHLWTKHAVVNELKMSSHVHGTFQHDAKEIYSRKHKVK